MHSTLLPGQGVVRRKGSVFHVGTYIGWNLVAHIGPLGFRIDPLETFASGQKIAVTGLPVSIDLLNQRLWEVQNLSNTYDPIFHNCEHLASFLQKGIKESPQVQGAVIGLAVAAGAVAAGKMNPAAGLLTGLLCMWAGVQLMSPTTTAWVPASSQ